jgi:Poly (ADP-ribose) glycohydrolase (PARG)
MTEALERPLDRQIFDAQSTIDNHPPKLQHANKQLVYQIACPPNSVHRGQLVFSRWPARTLATIDLAHSYDTKIEENSGYFGYERSTIARQVEWYLNFAHADLFCAYGFGVFAQDEIQVAEHPVLASLREALLSAKIEPLTVERGMPTPILIRGVERRCTIATDINPALGRPQGLYGNNFARASAAAIAAATNPIDPPTITNIIAMEAPSGGYGSYQYDEIEYILTTAVTGFTAAKIESQLADTAPAVVIHTGFWGCGAYGGNRILMALLQLLAARLARIDRLVFHTGEPAGAPSFAKAQQLLERLKISSNLEIAELLTAIEAMKFHWGVSDGN